MHKHGSCNCAVQTGKARTSVVLAAALKLNVLGPNPNRVAILFSPPFTAAYSICIDGSETAKEHGVAMAVGAEPLWWSRADVGNAICEPIHLFGSAAETVTIVEFFTLSSEERTVPNAQSQSSVGYSRGSDRNRPY